MVRDPTESVPQHRSPGSESRATAPRPFFATSVGSFSDAPCGRFSPRSHWLTRPVVMFSKASGSSRFASVSGTTIGATPAARAAWITWGDAASSSSGAGVARRLAT